MLTHILSAEEILCAVPGYIKPIVSSLFEKEVDYTKQSVKLIKYFDNKQTLLSLKDPKIKFAIVRSDILLKIQQDHLPWKKIKNHYITISTLPYSSQLYLVQNKDKYDINIDSLLGKRISIGSLGDEHGYILKSLLDPPEFRYQLNYMSLSFEKSLKSIKRNTLEAYFGFLPTQMETDKFHFQSTFSVKEISILKQHKGLDIRYFGASVSYILIANTNTNDKEIESLIYRLEEKGLFSPITDRRYGHINRYIVQHLEQIQMVLNTKNIIMQNSTEVKNPMISKSCLNYHYGFLKLLRQKPALKKKIRMIRYRRPSKYKSAKSYLQRIEFILASIDAQKRNCDLFFLHKKTSSFKLTAQHINSLLN